MTCAPAVIDRSMPEGVSGGLVERAGRGVCGSHQLKDDRCGGGGKVRMGGMCVHRRSEGKKGFIAAGGTGMEHADVGNPGPASRMRDGDWDW